MKKVVIALSGGVDSAVAAALLVQQGYEVRGVTLRLWSEAGCEEENRCCTEETRLLAARLAKQLGFPFEVLDAAEAFRARVVQNFLDGYARGDTPSPCVFCNRHIKWDYLVDYAQSVGSDWVATGHYARIQSEPGAPQRSALYAGADPAKDQSYMLAYLTQTQLARTVLPLGELTKDEVRKIARSLGLAPAEQPDSQDLCFLGGTDYRDFLQRYVPGVAHPGPIRDRRGNVLGEHTGLAFYTVGQRKGLPSSERPLYVIEKRLAENALVVGHAEELGSLELFTAPVNWISGKTPGAPLRAGVKIRFRASPAPALVTPLPDGRARVTFDAPLRDITPGQAAVFYDGQRVLGGAEILPSMG